MHTTCRLCNSQSLQKKYISQRYMFEVVKCRGCGLFGVRNPPSEEYLREMYSNEESFHHFSESMQNNIVLLRYQDMLQEIRTILNSFNGSTSPIKPRLLDIGAGSGMFLDKARDFGFEIYGNEFSSSAIRLALKKYNIHLESHSINSDLRNSYFDVITMWGLLEHVREPMDVLANATRLLKSGGLLFIYTPVWCLYDELGLLFAQTTHWTRLLDRRITTAHLQLFPQKTLEWACKHVGLQILNYNAVCEYNLPINAYLESLVVPNQLRKSLGFLVEEMIDHNLFFRNNSRVLCRKI